MSKHKRVSLKDYVLEFRPQLEQQMFRFNETLEGRMVDLKDWAKEAVADQNTKNATKFESISQDIDETVKTEIMNLHEAMSKQQTDCTVVADEVSKMREELEALSVKFKEEAKKIQESHQAGPEKKMREGSPVKLVAKLQNITTMGQNANITAL